MGRNIWLVYILLAVLSAWTGFAQITTDEVTKSPEKLYDYAYNFYARDMLEMSLAQLDKFIARYPNDSQVEQVYLLKISCLDKLGRKQEALEQIRQFRKKYPTSEQREKLTISAVEILQDLKRYGDCSGLLDELKKSSTESTREYAEYTRGRIWSIEGKKPQALAAFKALAEKKLDIKNQYRVLAAYQYSSMLAAQGQLSQALEWCAKLLALPGLPQKWKKEVMYDEAVYLKALRKYPEALQKIQNYIATYPQDERIQAARKLRFLVVVENQNYRYALECGQEWNQLYPEAKDCDVDYCYALTLLQTRHYDEALAFFARVLGYPNCPVPFQVDVRYYSIYCQMMKNQYDAVVQTCDEFLQHHPKSVKVGYVQNWKGVALGKLKRYAEAESSFRKAMGFFTESPEEYETVGKSLVDCYCNQKQWLKAASVYRKMSMNPSLQHGKKHLLRSAELAFYGGNADLALNDLKQAALDKDMQISKLAHIQTAEILVELKRYQEAIVEFQMVLSLVPAAEQPNIVCRIAMCYFKLKQNKEGTTYLKQALENPAFNGKKRNAALYMMAKPLLADKMYEQALPILDVLFAEPLEKQSYITDRFIFQAEEAYVALKHYDQANWVLKRILDKKDVSEDSRRQARVRQATDILVPQKKLYEAMRILRQELEQLDKNPKSPALEKNMIAASLAVIYLDLKMPDVALTFADRVLKSDDNSDATHAKVLYVKAAVSFYYDQNYARANEYATQCYMLTNDPVYCPKTMEISIQAFKKLGKPEHAKTVEKELQQRFKKKQ